MGGRKAHTHALESSTHPPSAGKKSFFSVQQRNGTKRTADCRQSRGLPRARLPRILSLLKNLRRLRGQCCRDRRTFKKIICIVFCLFCLLLVNAVDYLNIYELWGALPRLRRRRLRGP